MGCSQPLSLVLKKRCAEHFFRLLCFGVPQATIPPHGKDITLSGRHPLTWKKRCAEKFSRLLFCGVLQATIPRHGKDVALGTCPDCLQFGLFQATILRYGKSVTLSTLPDYCVLGCSRPPSLVMEMTLCKFPDCCVLGCCRPPSPVMEKRYIEHFFRLPCFGQFQGTIPRHGKQIVLCALPD